jgi:glutaredoxin 3
MIEIYGKPSCPFCDRAKKFCESNQLKFKYFQLDVDFTREGLFEMFPGARTFPQIKVHSESIGGYQELLEYVENTGYNGTGSTLG